MKIVVAVMLAIAATFALSSAIVAGAPDRPPGVSADEWAPISDSVGVVLVQRPPSLPRVADPHALLLAPPAEGYFMVKTGKQWRRLVVVEPIKGPGASG